MNHFYTTSPEPNCHDLHDSPVAAINAVIEYWRNKNCHYKVDFHVLEENRDKNLYCGRNFRVMGHWCIDSDTHTATRLDY